LNRKPITWKRDLPFELPAHLFAKVPCKNSAGHGIAATPRKFGAGTGMKPVTSSLPRTSLYQLSTQAKSLRCPDRRNNTYCGALRPFGCHAEIQDRFCTTHWCPAVSTTYWPSAQGPCEFKERACGRVRIRTSIARQGAEDLQSVVLATHPPPSLGHSGLQGLPACRQIQT